MNKLKEEIKEYAKKLGADIVGIADVERFKNAPLRMSPKNCCFFRCLFTKSEV